MNRFFGPVGRLHIGVFGPGAKHRAERMLRTGWIHIVGSDAHGASERSPTMGHALRVLNLWGEEAENLVFRVGPAAILEDRSPGSAPAIPFQGQSRYDGELETFFGRVMRFFRE